MDEIRTWTMDHFAEVEGLAHGFLGRLGGVSPAPWESLNLSISTGDSEANVRANLKAVRDRFGFQRLATVHQVHGARVVLADGNLPLDDFRPLTRADGLVTAHRGLGLILKTADCLGVALVDPVQRAVGLVHAGWRGLLAGAVISGVRAMETNFGSAPADLLAGIGPSLGPCCAEFVNYRQEFPKEYWSYNDGGDHFDLWAIARDQMISQGLLGGNIKTLGLCSRCQGDLFFSHRGQGPVTGRMGVILGFVS